MKKINASLKQHWVVLSLMLYCCLFIYSCKKDMANEFNTTEITTLKNWYNANASNFGKISKMFTGLTPDFSRNYIAVKDGLNVTEIEFNTPNKLIFASTKPDDKTAEQLRANTVARLVFFNKNDQDIRAAYMIITSEKGKINEVHYKDLKDLSGTIRFYNLDGSFQNGYYIENGKVSKKFSVPTRNDLNLLSLNDKLALKAGKENLGSGDRLMLFDANGGCNISVVNTYTGQCVSIRDHPEIPTYCSWEVSGADIYITCDGGAGNDGGAGYTGPGTDGPGGSGSGPNPPEKIRITPEITVDPNARNCISSISSIILSKAGLMSNCLADIAGIANINVSTAINTLAASNTFNITISEKSIPNLYTTDGNGNDIVVITNGSTNPRTGNITLNTDMLNEATDLAIASTMIHEMMHSYFIYGMTRTTGNERTFFQSMNNYLYGQDGIPNIEYESAQHEQMAATYVHSMASLLGQYAISQGILTSPDNSISLTEYCEDLFWKNLSQSQSKITPPNKARAERNATKEFKNESGSTKKKGC